jgi:hypothetical protein
MLIFVILTGNIRSVVQLSFHYADCHSARCPVFIMLSVIMLSVVVLVVIMLCAFILSGIILSIDLPIVVMLDIVA